MSSSSSKRYQRSFSSRSGKFGRTELSSSGTRLTAEGEEEKEGETKSASRYKTRTEKFDEIADSVANEWAEQALERVRSRKTISQQAPDETKHEPTQTSGRPRHQRPFAGRGGEPAESSGGVQASGIPPNPTDMNDIAFHVEEEAPESKTKKRQEEGVRLPTLDFDSAFGHSGTGTTPRQQHPGQTDATTWNAADADLQVSPTISSGRTPKTSKQQQNQPLSRKRAENLLGPLASQTDVKLPDYELEEGDEEIYEKEKEQKKNGEKLKRVEKNAREIIENREKQGHSRPITPSTAGFMYSCLKELKWALDIAKRDLRVWQRKYNRRDRLLQLVKQTYHRDVFFIREHFFRSEREGKGTQWEPTFQLELPSSVELDELLMLFGLRGKIKAVDSEEWDMVRNKATHYDQLKDEYDLLSEESRKLAEKHIRLSAFVERITSKIEAAQKEKLDAQRHAEKLETEKNKLKQERDDAFRAVRELRNEASRKNSTGIDFQKISLEGISNEEDVENLMKRNINLRKQVHALAEVVAQYEDEHTTLIEGTTDDGTNKIDRLRQELKAAEKQLNEYNPAGMTTINDLQIQRAANSVSVSGQGAFSAFRQSLLEHEHFGKGKPKLVNRRHSFSEMESAVLHEAQSDDERAEGKPGGYEGGIGWNLFHHGRPFTRENEDQKKQDTVGSKHNRSRRGSMPPSLYDTVSLGAMRSKYEASTVSSSKKEKGQYLHSRTSRSGWGLLKDMSTWQSQSRFVFSNTIMDKYREWLCKAEEDTRAQASRYWSLRRSYQQTKKEVYSLRKKLEQESSSMKMNRALQEEFQQLRQENRDLQKTKNSVARERDNLQYSLDETRRECEQLRWECHRLRREGSTGDADTSFLQADTVWRMLLYSIRRERQKQKNLRKSIMRSKNLNLIRIQGGNSVARAQTALDRVKSLLGDTSSKLQDLKSFRIELKSSVETWMDSTKSQLTQALNYADDLERYRSRIASLVTRVNSRWKDRELKSTVYDVKNKIVANQQEFDSSFVDIRRHLNTLVRRSQAQGSEYRQMKNELDQKEELLLHRDTTIKELEKNVNAINEKDEERNAKIRQFTEKTLRKSEAVRHARIVVASAIRSAWDQLLELRRQRRVFVGTQTRIPTAESSAQTPFSMLTYAIAESQVGAQQRHLEFEGNQDALRTDGEVTGNAPKKSKHKRRNSIAGGIPDHNTRPQSSPVVSRKTASEGQTEGVKRFEGIQEQYSSARNSPKARQRSSLPLEKANHDNALNRSTSPEGYVSNVAPHRGGHDEHDMYIPKLPVSSEYYKYLLRESASRKLASGSAGVSRDTGMSQRPQSSQRRRGSTTSLRSVPQLAPSQQGSIEDSVGDEFAFRSPSGRKSKSAPGTRRRRASVAAPYNVLDSELLHSQARWTELSASPWEGESG
eukprot:gb/GECG01013234.1/.p1 GENE.gb/GECG01013234.1/~~gb/GECG01013234.1/.p1  ORF type:complete len:1407 (+),score=265.98 gb/GECG01013234.1/:1-4221(+)